MAETSAHGHTGSTRARHSALPVEPGGVSYDSSPQKLAPQNHQTRYEMATLPTVLTTHRAHRCVEVIASASIGPRRRVHEGGDRPRRGS